MGGKMRWLAWGVFFAGCAGVGAAVSLALYAVEVIKRAEQEQRAGY